MYDVMQCNCDGQKMAEIYFVHSQQVSAPEQILPATSQVNPIY